GGGGGGLGALAGGAHALPAGLGGGGGGPPPGPPPATRTLITRFLTTPDPAEALAPPALLTTLTDREREVMSLAALGKSNAEIAEQLVLSHLTVRSHIQRAMTKLHARDRAQLVVIAYQSGLVEAKPPGR
ncbi:response regulator transcription factor, partial [Streptomyces acidiscabies]